MLGSSWLDLLAYAWIGVALIIFVALQFFRAAYGRYVELSRGPKVSATLGWIVMESVSALLFAELFFSSGRLTHLPSLVFFAMWELHYVHRSFVYPLRARIRGKQLPLSIAAMGVVFNVVNASLNGLWLFHVGPLRDSGWLLDWRFVLGVLVFVGGMAVNISSDYRLVRLRNGGHSGYSIPSGGLFRWVSCPNYLGEIVEWCGWALATWSLAGLSFAAWTFANLAPRALSHHRWYLDRFANYPRDRRALFPFII